MMMQDKNEKANSENGVDNSNSVKVITNNTTKVLNSESSEHFNDGTMWRSEDDIVKDLAFLNHFGTSEDTDLDRILYSTGRGSKIKDFQKERSKSPEKFIDPRTGDVIDINDAELTFDDTSLKGRGRGRLFGSFSVKKYQLQEQLRLARPLGSGDEAIESYCRRNRPGKTSTSTSLSCGDSVPKVENKNRRNSENPTPRLKGCRNSAPESNALMNSLLSKTKAKPTAGGNNTEDDSVKCNFNHDSQSFRDSLSKTERKEKGQMEHGQTSGGAADCFRTDGYFGAKTDSKMEGIYNADTESMTSDESTEVYTKNFPPLPPLERKKNFPP